MNAFPWSRIIFSNRNPILIERDEVSPIQLIILCWGLKAWGTLGWVNNFSLVLKKKLKKKSLEPIKASLVQRSYHRFCTLLNTNHLFN